MLPLWWQTLRTRKGKIKRARERGWYWSLPDNHVLCLVLYTPTLLPMMSQPWPLLYLKPIKYLFQPCSLAHSSVIIFTLGLRRLVRPLPILSKYAEHFSTTTRRNSTKDSHNSGNLKPYSFLNSVWVFKVSHWSLIIEGIVRWGLRFIVLIREDLQV